MFFRSKLAPRFFRTGSTAIAVCTLRPDGRPDLNLGDFGFNVIFLPFHPGSVTADELFFARQLAEQAGIYARACEHLAQPSVEPVGEEAPI